VPLCSEQRSSGWSTSWSALGRHAPTPGHGFGSLPCLPPQDLRHVCPGELVVKLPRPASTRSWRRRGRPIDANKGTPMKEWLRLSATSTLTGRRSPASTDFAAVGGADSRPCCRLPQHRRPDLHVPLRVPRAAEVALIAQKLSLAMCCCCAKVSSNCARPGELLVGSTRSRSASGGAQLWQADKPAQRHWLAPSFGEVSPNCPPGRVKWPRRLEPQRPGWRVTRSTDLDLPSIHTDTPEMPY